MLERPRTPQITLHHIGSPQAERRAKVLIVDFPECRCNRDFRKRVYRKCGAAAPFPIHRMDKARHRAMPSLELRSQQDWLIIVFPHQLQKELRAVIEKTVAEKARGHLMVHDAALAQ
jgi:hypothetical protein